MRKTIRVSGDGFQYIGKQLMVGITIQNAAGSVLRQEQFHGRIVLADDDSIVVERADNGKRVSLPPELAEAPPGQFTLQATGEVITNPDYFARWIWTEADEKDSGAETI